MNRTDAPFKERN